MNKLPYDELWIKYLDAQKTINELAQTLKKREDEIELLNFDIQELQEILYEHGIFEHFDFE